METTKFKLKKTYFSFHLKWLLVLGIEVSEIKSPFLHFLFQIYSILLIGTGIILYAILEAIGTLKTNSFKEATFSLSYLVTHFLGAVKIIYALIEKKTIRDMLEKLQTGYFLPDLNRGGKKEFELIHNAIRLSDLHVNLFDMFVYIIIGVRSLYAIVNSTMTYEFDEVTNSTILINGRILPYNCWLPIDEKVSPYYEIIFFYQAFCLILYGLYIGAIDSLIYGLMIHMKAQCLIVKNCLDHYLETSKKKTLSKNPGEKCFNSENIKLPPGYDVINTTSDKMNDEIERIIDNCIRHHYDIIEYCDKIESEFTFLMLCQFLSSLYILCFQLFQLSVSNPASFDFISMCLYLILMMYQLFCYCWHGNELMMHSGEMSNYVYHTDWVATSNRIKKKLLMMMIRCQKPARFTAGKFALLSLQTYMTIVRGSASYFMVLQQMNNR